MIWLLAVQAFATLFMVGVVWMCQIAHYPLFREIGPAMAAYQPRNRVLTTYVVGPPMLIELGCAIAVVALRPTGVPLWVALIGLALVVIAWVATATLSIPAHMRLDGGYDDDAHRRLVTTNWIRTAVWSARGALVLWMLVMAAHSPSSAG
jgi:hypothetical protein